MGTNGTTPMVIGGWYIKTEVTNYISTKEMGYLNQRILDSVSET